MPRLGRSLLVAALSGHLAAAVLDGPRRHRGSLLQREPRNDALVEEASTLTTKLPFYHTSEQLRSEVQRLVGNCRGADASVKTITKDGVSLDAISVRGKQASPVNKVFMLFGEHSRELISPESGLHLLKALCGEAALGDTGDQAAQALLQSEFQIVLNGNPRSRAKVESGDYCLRVNPSGVDLNRNWDARWRPDPEDETTRPGPRPFSEPETQIIRDLVSDYKPTTFLSIHSGNLGLYMPWAYDREHSAERNKASMMEVMKAVDAAHCQCPFGAAGKEVGYSCPGASLDWVYDKLGTPYAFAYEIYLDPAFTEGFKERWQEKLASGGAALLELGESLEHPHFHELYHGRPSDFVQVSNATAAAADGGSSAEDCLTRFNPTTQASYEATIKNWAAAYLDTAQAVAQDIARRAARSQQ